MLGQATPRGRGAPDDTNRARGEPEYGAADGSPTLSSQRDLRRRRGRPPLGRGVRGLSRQRRTPLGLSQGHRRGRRDPGGRRAAGDRRGDGHPAGRADSERHAAGLRVRVPASRPRRARVQAGAPLRGRGAGGHRAASRPGERSPKPHGWNSTTPVGGSGSATRSRCSTRRWRCSRGGHRGPTRRIERHATVRHGTSGGGALRAT